MTAGRLVIVTAALAALPLVLFSQQARDPASGVPNAGTAGIHGVVTDGAPTHAPVRRAMVTIAGGPSGGRSVVSDDEGRFAFDGLMAGTYNVTTAKPAYLPGAYGARRPGRAGTPIALAAGQQIEVTIAMTRGAVVSGAIRDARGGPLAGMQVGALNLRAAGAPDAIFSSGAFATTDDRGMYRIFGLMPGEYVVAATPRTLNLGAVGVRATADMDALIVRLQQRASGNGAPVAGGAAPASTRLPQPIAYAHGPTYFPGASQFRDAAHVTIAAGEERTGLDFAVTPIRSTTIEGVVQGPVSDIATVQLTIVIGGPHVPQELGTTPTLSQRPDARGRFRYTNVTPGQYKIVARGIANPPVVAPAVGRAGGGRGVGTGAASGLPISASGDWLYGVAEVDITGQDVTDVALTLVPGSVFSGRVAFDTAAAAVDVTKINVKIAPPSGKTIADTDGVTLTGNPFAALPLVAVKSDGTFAVPGIGPGTYGLFTTVPPEISQRWWLRSAIVNGRDLLDTGLDARPGVDVANAVLTFSDRHTELTGRLTTGAGAPAPEYFVIVLPADRTLWRPNARRVKVTRPATDGTFRVSDLPAGDYLVVALDDVAPNEWNDAQFLERIASSGVAIKLGEGEKKVQDLRVSR